MTRQSKTGWAWLRLLQLLQWSPIPLDGASSSGVGPLSFQFKENTTNAIAVWASPQIIAVISFSGFSLLAFLVYGKHDLSRFNPVYTHQDAEFNFGNDHNAYPAYLMRNLTHVSQMALAGVHTLIWWFAPIAQLVIFLTVTPRFGMKGAWENVGGAGSRKMNSSDY